jgi:diaminohydroxyphosphoribosylaminopyrimidine deaminase/5-amino-6-(5-phosphoribosylamino)uracil reductase
VTLEPCAHFGKTPPCVDAVIRAGFKHVVIAMLDPNPLTAGKSVRKLRRSGVKVEVGVGTEEAQYLNRFFTKHIKTGMPYVIAKVAVTLDGALTLRRGKRTQISGAKALAYVQDLRAQVSAILVGRETVRVDDPLLTVRDAKKPQPARVILDSRLRTSLRARLFKSGAGKVILVSCAKTGSAKAVQFKKMGVEVMGVDAMRHNLVSLQRALQALGQKGYSSILCEGGAEVLQSLQRQRLVDEWQIIVAPRVVRTIVPRLALSGIINHISQPFCEVKTLGQDLLVIVQTHYA